MLDVVPIKRRRTSFTLIEFNCYVSAVCTSMALNSVKKINFSYIPASNEQNRVVHRLKCFGFWSTSSPRPLFAVGQWTPVSINLFLK